MKNSYEKAGHHQGTAGVPAPFISRRVDCLPVYC